MTLHQEQPPYQHFHLRPKGTYVRGVIYSPYSYSHPIKLIQSDVYTLKLYHEEFISQVQHYHELKLNSKNTLL